MNPSTNSMKSFIYQKLLIVLILGLLIVPFTSMAQETTEEPQADAVVTEEIVEEQSVIVETEAPTEEPVVETPDPTEAPVVETEAPDVVSEEETPTEDANVEATEAPSEEAAVDVEPTEEILSESTEEPTVDIVETEAVEEETAESEETTVPEIIIIDESVNEVTSISEDFEAWAGENWTVSDWSVAQVDDSLALTSNILDASASIISVDWEDYTILVDVKVETDNTLSLNFDGYSLIINSDGTTQLLQGEEFVAAPPVSIVEETEPTWHTVSINKTDTTITILVDNVPQYGFETTDTPLGIFAFIAGGDQGVAIDNLAMAKVEESETVEEIVTTPTPDNEIVDSPEATEEPDLLAESTEEPDLLVETTEEPDLLAEATEEPAVSVEEDVVEPTYILSNLISDDFEGDLSSWVTTASLVEIAEGNHVLLMGAGGQLTPIAVNEANNLLISGQANIMSDSDVAGSFSIVLSDTYAIEISTTGITVTANGEVVVVAESVLSLNTWFTFSVNASATDIVVAINDVEIIATTGEFTLDGNFAVSANTSVMFDNIVVDTLVEEEIILPEATAVPEASDSDILDKLSGNASKLMKAYFDGGDEAVATYLSETNASQDEAGRILVDVLASKTSDGDTIVQIITDAGGIVTRTYRKSVEAYVDVNILLAISNNENIRFIRNINRAVSTGPTGNNGGENENLPGDNYFETWTEAYNAVSAEAWHLQNVKGQDVKIGVIDTGFEDADSSDERNDNLACLASTALQSGPGGSTALFDNSQPSIIRDHGTQIIEVVCDIAPEAAVYMFRADEPESLTDAITAARNSGNRMDILLITLDLGVNTSAGGGISGSIDYNVYAQLEAAKEEGIVTIVASGNNNLRTLVVEIPTGESDSFTIDLNVTDGDMIKFGWNDFDDDDNAIVEFDVELDIDKDTSVDDSNDSDDPLNKPLSLIADDDGLAELTVNIISAPTETVYLQIQISPVIVGDEIPHEFDENNVKFIGTIDEAGGTDTIVDITSTVGNLGRPADSDDVISVGAICIRRSDNPMRWEFSSNGPRFKPDGSPLDSGWDTIITQEEAKPSLMGYSFVSTSAVGANSEAITEDGDLLTCEDGFGGTSSAAAHVAGMTALLMSNDNNTSFADLNETNANSSSTFEDIRDYLQSHSVDLPLGANADGFDVTYGSGLSILGAPTYDLDETVNLGVEADLLPESCQLGNTYYVGQANMGNTAITGNIASPFMFLGEALNASSPDCIVVMPGEYVTPIVIDNSYTDLLITGYNDVSRTSVDAPIVWLRGLYFGDSDINYGSPTATYRRHAGVYFTDQADSVEFSGFTFVVSPLYKSNDAPDEEDRETYVVDVQAVVMDGSTDTTISNSQFGTVSLSGVEYPGWVNIKGTPILVLNGAQGTRIENNTFNDNIVTTVGGGFYPTMAIIDSGGDTDNDPTNDNPIVVINNKIHGNQIDTISSAAEWGAILYANGSAIDIINNAIYDNTGETIIKIATSDPFSQPATAADRTHRRQARIIGNVFLENETVDNGANGGAPGPLINSRYAPMMYIINNTMISNTIPTSNSDFGHFISRGNKAPANTTGSNPAGWDFWEIHNNLIYNNTFRQFVGDTFYNNACHRIPNDISDSDLNAFAYATSTTFDPINDDGTFEQRGAQNNWFSGNNFTGLSNGFGDCTIAISTNKNDTIGTPPAYLNQNIVFGDLQPVDESSSDDTTYPYSCNLAEDEDQGTLIGDFRGYECDSPFKNNVSAWQFYALAQTYVAPESSILNEYSDGIDAGKDQWLSDTGGGDAGDPYLGGADIDVDIIGTARILNVIGWVINWEEGYGYVPATDPPRGISGTYASDSVYQVDIGAFEFSPLQFATNDSEVVEGKIIAFYDTDQSITVNSVTLDPITDDLDEDNGIVSFDLSTVVTGGFGNVSYSIAAAPNNYGTQCGEQFDNTKGLVQRAGGFNEIFDYCPPANFYTLPNDYVSFKILVKDEAGASTVGELRFTIDAVMDSTFDDDTDLAIGDEDPEADVFEVITTLGSNITVRLRPYVRFENFFFSENGNEEFLVGPNKVIDYPFEYQITGISDSNPPILVGASTDGDFTSSPNRPFTLSESETGVAEITYSVRDANGTISDGNILKIRSVSIIPTEGLLDDTNLVWNYSDDTNSVFYTERDGFQGADVPTSGDWQALRQTSAINNTVHTTSTTGDTATFRFVGTGFTLYMRNGSETGSHFEINIYDQNDDKLTGGTWSALGGSIVNQKVVSIDEFNPDPAIDLTCTTRADIDLTDNTRLLHSEDAYTVTCNGLDVRKHTVQVVNSGGGELSVDAFSIISDLGDFDDADPLPPGFYDIDNGLLRNAFSGWTEDFNSGYSNGIALLAPAGSTDIIFTITDASGFAIGSAYDNTAEDFVICVDDDKVDDGEGVCTTVTVKDDVAGEDLLSIHHPFFGLNPDNSYTVKVALLANSGFVFDDLVIFDDSIIPTDVLPLGQTSSNDTKLVVGEPFGDDWEISGDDLVITDGRSPIGPFIAFQIADNVDSVGITMTNEVIDTCVPSKKVTCPPPPPSGLAGLQICVNRGIQAGETDGTTPNCIVVETITGSGPVQVIDNMLIIDDSLFPEDPWDSWGSSENNTVEIFSLTNDENLTFTSVQVLSSEFGLGAGQYAGYASGIEFVDFNPADGTYTDLEPDDVSTSWVNRDITQCFAEKKGVCTDLRVIGSVLETTGVGDAALIQMQATGFAPIFTESSGSYAQACWIADSEIGSSDVDDIAAEVRAEAPENGGCRVFDNDGSDSGVEKPVYGLEPDIYWVLIELLPSSNNATVAMAFDGLIIYDEDWTGLTALDTTQRYETSYNKRFNDNRFQYTGDWSTVVDSSGSHSGTSYDKTAGDPDASILFKTTGGNVVQITRDLQDAQVICDSKAFSKGTCTAPDGNIDNVIFCSAKDQSRGDCPPSRSAYSDVMVCVADALTPDLQSCAAYSSKGDATQDILPISLPDNGDFVISVTSMGTGGFVIDAIDVVDSTSGNMVEGIYQEDSTLISYGTGTTEVLRDTSLENTTSIPSTGTWGWKADTATATVSTEQSFVGTNSAKVIAANSESLDSEEFQLINGETYTAIARVYVDTVSTSVDMGLIESTSTMAVQSTQSTGKWEFLLVSFEATATETARLTFIANGGTTFYVDDVHVYRGKNAWDIGAGGLTDGQIATSNGYGAVAKFEFDGTGFMVKLASDRSSGETKVCYDTAEDMSTANCFTYDNEQGDVPDICTISGKKEVCVPGDPTLNNGHTVLGLTGTHYVTVSQADNGSRTEAAADICTGSGKKEVCVPGDPANSPNDSATTVKLDYIQIFDSSTPSVLDAGDYNEDSSQIFPSTEWIQINSNGDTYYQVSGEAVAGSTIALVLENDETTTLVININEANEDADQLLACIDDIDGVVEFNGTGYDLTSSNCTLTTQATNQTELVFNKDNLPLIDGSGADRLFTLRSLTRDSVTIHGYQIINGTTLAQGFHQDILGHATTDAIFIMSDVSSTIDDWNQVSFKTYSGGTALSTAIDDATLTFEFEGTGISIVPSTGEPIETCTKEKDGICTSSVIETPLTGQIDVSLDTDTPSGADICSGDCDAELGLMTNLDVTNGPITIAGLPHNTYKVTITAALDADEEISFDAVEVYGQLQELGSLYDDAQIDINDDLLLTYGPTTSNWQAFTGASGSFLNKTFHQANSAGSTVSFRVGAGDYFTDGIIIYDGNPTTSSTNVDVCWSEDGGGSLARTCETINLNDGVSANKVDITPAGTYNVSITNQANGEPLVIDAIQILEDGIMTEGIYEDDDTDLVGGTTVTNTSSPNSSVRQLTNGQSLVFKFEGVAFSTQIVESGVLGSETSLNYDICAYSGDVTETDCSNTPDMTDTITTLSNNTLSSLTYAGFTDTSGLENANGLWTIVIDNNHANPLLIDRIDILGNNNDLYIEDTKTYEAGEVQLRYLPFGSWVENTSFKDDTPLNGGQFETTLPGAITYFEFGSDTFGVEYARQIQKDEVIENCLKFKKGVCSSVELIDVPAFANGNICIGALGDPVSMSCTAINNDTASLFQFGSSTETVDCTNGCWAYIDYGRDAIGSSQTTVDYIRLYDPASALTTGIYQENHPAISYSISGTDINDENANVGFYRELESSGSGAYVSFPFEGTGYSVRTVIGDMAEDIELCVYEYTYGGAIPDASSVIGSADCIHSYDQDEIVDSFATRALHGLNHDDANYLAIIKMANDSATGTILGIDQIEIFDQQWFDESDLTDDTYTEQLVGGSSYEIDFQKRDTDKLVQFIGNQWITFTEQIQTGCADKKCKQPIFTTLESDRGMGSGTTALFRTNDANSATIDLMINGTGDVQVCGVPMMAGFDVNLGAGSNCQTVTVTGETSVSFIFSDASTDEHVVTVELLTPSITTSEEVCVTEKKGVCQATETITTTTNPWMNITNVSLLNVLSGLVEGQYDQNFPGIQYDTTFMEIVDENMEVDNANWETIGLATESQSQPEVCVGEGKSEVCTPPEPTFEGVGSRKIAANIGQGLEYVSGFDLDTDTYYTVLAHVLMDEASIGNVTMKVVDGLTELTETTGMDLTVTQRGKWQTVRATFKTEASYTGLKLQFVVGTGATTLYLDEVSITKGGEWANASAPLGPDICTGSGKKQVCVPGNPAFDIVGSDIFQSTTPGASFTFDFVGTGFELGLVGGNRTGDVEVCYHPESDANDVNCFTYGQDDGVIISQTTCVAEKKGVCQETFTSFKDTAALYGRGITGLESITWTVTVREMDDGYSHGDPSQSRQGSKIVCVPGKKGCTDVETAIFTTTVFGIDYVNIFDDTDIVAVPVGSFNEDATDGSDNDYLKVYPEDNWEILTGTNVFSNKSYIAPKSEWTGPTALLQLDVDVSDDVWTVVFQFGRQSSSVTDSVLICVDDTNGVMTWENDQYTLVDSDNCMIFNDIASDNQVSVTSEDIPALATTDLHNVTITSLSPLGQTVLEEVCVSEKKGVCRATELQPTSSKGYLRIDGYQIFEGNVLSAGFYNELLPGTLLNFSGDGLDKSTDCDTSASWCQTKSKTQLQEVCVSEKKGVCKKTEIQSVTTNPYLGGAAIVAQEGATLDFTIQGTGFSVISDVDSNGLDFRVCYKLNSSGSSFPGIGSSEEEIALDGVDASDQPIRISEGGILCEELTTDTDNWDVIMDRPLSSGEQYGFSFYGMPLSTYDVQVMVITSQDQISSDEWFTIDAVQVFSDMSTLSELPVGLTDDSDENISYEPAVFWDTNATSNTYLNTDSTTDNAGSIAQFTIAGNSLVLYQTVGDMTTDIQLCVIISNENIHCSVESERQTRIARQVTSFTQYGALVETTICTKFKKDVCSSTSTSQVLENSPFTPIVFYGLGDEGEHQIITENRVQGETFNLDAIQVLD